MATINSADKAAAWAYWNLPAKNSLTAAGAKIVEERAVRCRFRSLAPSFTLLSRRARCPRAPVPRYWADSGAIAVLIDELDERELPAGRTEIGGRGSKEVNASLFSDGRQSLQYHLR